MTSASVVPVWAFSMMDANGEPLVGAQLFTFEEGSVDTTLETYKDVALTVEHDNPILTDAAGRFPDAVYAQPALYKFVLKDADDNTLQTILVWRPDNLDGAEDVIYTPTHTGGVARSVASRLADLTHLFDFIPANQHNNILNRTSAYDATSDIQAAYDALSNGGVLYKPSGLYNVTQDGANNWCVQNTSDNLTIWADGAEMKTADDVQVFRSVNADNLRIKGLRVRGTGVPGSDLSHGLLQITGGDNIHLEDIFAFDANADAIAVAGATNVWLTRPYAQNCSKTAVYVNGCTNAFIRDGLVEDVVGHTVSGSLVGTAYQYSSNDGLVSGGCRGLRIIGHGVLCNALTGGDKPNNNEIFNNYMFDVSNPTNPSQTNAYKWANGNADKITGNRSHNNTGRQSAQATFQFENNTGMVSVSDRSYESVVQAFQMSGIVGMQLLRPESYNSNTSLTAGRSDINTINTCSDILVDRPIMKDLAGYTAGGTDKVVEFKTGTTTSEWRRRSGWVKHNTVHTGITSGTEIDWTDIPAGVTHIKIVHGGFSADAADELSVRLGDSGGFHSTAGDYSGRVRNATAGTEWSTEAAVTNAMVDAHIVNGQIEITNIDGNLWNITGTATVETVELHVAAGRITTDSALTSVRMFMDGGAAFDNDGGGGNAALYYQ